MLFEHLLESLQVVPELLVHSPDGLLGRQSYLLPFRSLTPLGLALVQRNGSPALSATVVDVIHIPGPALPLHLQVAVHPGTHVGTVPTAVPVAVTDLLSRLRLLVQDSVVETRTLSFLV